MKHKSTSDAVIEAIMDLITDESYAEFTAFAIYSRDRIKWSAKSAELFCYRELGDSLPEDVDKISYFISVNLFRVDFDKLAKKFRKEAKHYRIIPKK